EFVALGLAIEQLEVDQTDVACDDLAESLVGPQLEELRGHYSRGRRGRHNSSSAQLDQTSKRKRIRPKNSVAVDNQVGREVPGPRRFEANDHTRALDPVIGTAGKLIFLNRE